MEDLEKVLDDIEKFENNPDNEDLPDSLGKLLKHVAITGDPVFPWIKIKYAIRQKLSLVMSAFYEVYGAGDVEDCAVANRLAYTTETNKILQQFDNFTGAPFTIQRICEMLLDPRKHYHDPYKFIRGIEKNILVVSCVLPGCVRQSDISQESIVNGMMEDVSLYLGVHPQENSCNSEMNNTNSNEAAATNEVAEKSYSSESSSGSSSASSSSPIPDDEQEVIEPSAKRFKLGYSMYGENMDFDPEIFATPDKNSAGSPDSAQDTDKNQTEVEKETDDTDNDCEAMATLTENTEEPSKEIENLESQDSLEADSTSQPSINEAPSTEVPTLDFAVENVPVESTVSTADNVGEGTSQNSDHLASDTCKDDVSESSTAPCTSSIS